MSVRFRPVSELPQNPPPWTRIVAVLDCLTVYLLYFGPDGNWTDNRNYSFTRDNFRWCYESELVAAAMEEVSDAD